MKKKLHYLIFAFVMLLFTSCTSLDQMLTIGGAVVETVAAGVDAAEGVPPEAEYTIGRSVAATIVANYDILEDQNITDYLNKICTTLVIKSDRPYMYKGYYVAVIDSDEVNAISTPGGHIFISRGLLECTDSEDAVAAIIAHELSHIQLGHAKKIIENKKVGDFWETAARGTVAIVLSGDEDFSMEDLDGLRDITNDFLREALRSGFSKDQEYEADANALKLMKTAGYNPYALIDMLKAIDNGRGKSESGWFKTHPAPGKRIIEVEKELKKGGYEKTDMVVREERFYDDFYYYLY